MITLACEVMISEGCGGDRRAGLAVRQHPRRSRRRPVSRGSPWQACAPPAGTGIGFGPPRRAPADGPRGRAPGMRDSGAAVLRHRRAAAFPAFARCVSAGSVALTALPYLTDSQKHTRRPNTTAGGRTWGHGPMTYRRGSRRTRASRRRHRDRPGPRQPADDPALVRGHGRHQPRLPRRRRHRPAHHAPGLDDGRPLRPRRPLRPLRRTAPPPGRPGLHLGRRHRLRAGVPAPAAAGRHDHLRHGDRIGVGPQDHQAGHRPLRHHPHRHPRGRRPRGHPPLPHPQVRPRPPTGTQGQASPSRRQPRQRRLLAGRRRAPAAHPALHRLRHPAPPLAARLQRLRRPRLGHGRGEWRGHRPLVRRDAPPALPRLRPALRGRPGPTRGRSTDGEQCGRGPVRQGAHRDAGTARIHGVRRRVDASGVPGVAA